MGIKQQKLKDFGTVLGGITMMALFVGLGIYLGRNDIADFLNTPKKYVTQQLTVLLVGGIGIGILVGVCDFSRWLEKKYSLYKLSSGVKKGSPTCGACVKLSTKECALRLGFMSEMRPACDQFVVSPDLPHIGEVRGFLYKNALRILGGISVIGAVAAVLLFW